MPGTRRFYRPLASTTAIPAVEPEQKTIATTESGWKVLLYNDDVTPIDVVIVGLQKAAGLSIEVAEMVAMEAHDTGRAIVKRGLTREDAEIVCGLLKTYTRIEGFCPGVECEAVKDEDA